MHNDLQCYNELQYTMDTMEQWPTITYNIQWATMDNDTTIKSHANTTLLFIYYNGIVLKWQWTQWITSQYYNVQQHLYSLCTMFVKKNAILFIQRCRKTSSNIVCMKITLIQWHTTL